jgi:hypothetical protein
VKKYSLLFTLSGINTCHIFSVGILYPVIFVPVITNAMAGILSHLIPHGCRLHKNTLSLALLFLKIS